MDDLPNLFVVGAPKSGTTALYVYFSKHPDIFVDEHYKEPSYMALYAGLPHLDCPALNEYLANNTITSLSKYKDIYRARNGKKIAADLSPMYLRFPQASRKIAELCPNARIVIVLRNPVECAFSMFSMNRREGWEGCATFRSAWERNGNDWARGFL